MMLQNDIDVTDLALPVADAAHCLPTLQKALADNPDGTVFITDQGKPTMVLISWPGWQAMAGLLETLEVIADPKTMADLRQSIAAGDGDAVPWAAVRQQLIADGRPDPGDI